MSVYLGTQKLDDAGFSTGGGGEAPIYLSQLIDDENHRTVSDAQIYSWNNPFFPHIPVALNELVQDSEHRTVTDTQIEAWTNGGAIPEGTELQTNKVTTITSSSTNNEYPSAKAVYQFVIQKIAESGGGTTPSTADWSASY